MMTTPILSLRPGPYSRAQKTFRGLNLEIIFSLLPLMAFWFYLAPGLWLPTALLISFLGFWILGTKIFARIPEKNPHPGSGRLVNDLGCLGLGRTGEYLGGLSVRLKRSDYLRLSGVN
jgi:hypothetical protein